MDYGPRIGYNYVCSPTTCMMQSSSTTCMMQSSGMLTAPKMSLSDFWHSFLFLMSVKVSSRNALASGSSGSDSGAPSFLPRKDLRFPESVNSVSDGIAVVTIAMASSVNTARRETMLQDSIPKILGLNWKDTEIEWSDRQQYCPKCLLCVPSLHFGHFAGSSGVLLGDSANMAMAPKSCLRGIRSGKQDLDCQLDLLCNLRTVGCRSMEIASLVRYH